jgi:hypothetical protein
VEPWIRGVGRPTSAIVAKTLGCQFAQRRWLSRYRDCATCWTARALNPGRGKHFDCSPEGSDRLFGPLSILFIGSRFYSWVKPPQREINRHLCLVPRLGVTGATCVLHLDLFAFMAWAWENLRLFFTVARWVFSDIVFRIMYHTREEDASVIHNNIFCFQQTL